MLEAKGLKKLLIFAMIICITLLPVLGNAEQADEGTDYPTDIKSDFISENEIKSNRYAHPDNRKSVSCLLTTEGFEKVMENEYCQVWYRKSTTAIRVVDLSTGYIWGGLEQDKPDNLNKTWSAFANGIVGIDYYTDKGISKRIGAGASNTKSEYSVSGNTLKVSVDFKEVGISLAVNLTLKDNSITLYLQDDSITETGTNTLGAVYFLPFLGAVNADTVDGYMLVPDGSGALIRFSKPSSYLQGYEERVYGLDYAIDNLFEVNDLKANRPNDFATPEEAIHVPLFGIVHGVRQNAFYGVIENGAEYAAIVATPSGVLTDYNWATAKFIYRQKYMQPTSKSGAGVQVVQKNRNTVNPKLTYTFLHGDKASYAGMAVDYRGKLQKSGFLKAAATDSKKGIPLKLDLIMADIKKGFIWSGVQRITTTDQVHEIGRWLLESGINGQITLKGYESRGLNGHRKLSTKISNSKAISSLAEKLEAEGIWVFAEASTLSGNEKQFDINTQVGITLSQSIIKQESNNKDRWLSDRYFANISKAVDFIPNKVQMLKKLGISRINFTELGRRLYGNYLKSDFISRTEAMGLITKSASALAEGLGTFAAGVSNQYLWPYLQQMTDMPMSGSQYLFESDSVPFLQILLSGSMELFAPYANLSFYSDYDILKHIEYGVYPSFLLTGTPNHKLIRTPSGEYNSTYYPDWQEMIAVIYGKVNQSLGQVKGESVLDHTVLQQGVVKVDYPSGSIYVNYNSYPFKSGSVYVEAKSALFVKGE
ncbi:MAG TPA: hypothetical protein GXX54_01615 [Clostridiales bacterium]|nr:hypothetical protein [Clostridiales bacterium]